MLVLVALTGLSRPAQADDDERARELFLLGEDDYAAGRYEAAAKKYEEAYRLSRRPALLYNLGNTYERMGEYQKAADALQEYLSSPNPQRVRETRQRIKLLRKRAEDKRKKEEELRKLREGGGEGSGGGEGGGSGSEGGGGIVEPPPEGPSRLPSYLLIGGGGAAIVAGVVFAIGASSAGSDAEEKCDTDSSGRLLCPEGAQSNLDRERNLSIAADVSFLVGLGAVAAGVVLWVTADDPAAAEDAAMEEGYTVGPTLMPGGGGIGITGRF